MSIKLSLEEPVLALPHPAAADAPATEAPLAAAFAAAAQAAADDAEATAAAAAERPSKKAAMASAPLTEPSGLPLGMTLIPTSLNTNGETAGLPVGDGVLSSRAFVPLAAPGAAGMLPAAPAASGFADARDNSGARFAGSNGDGAPMSTGATPGQLIPGASAGTGGKLAPRRHSTNTNAAPAPVRLAAAAALPTALAAGALLLL
jgi:hypothetical protein